MKSELTQKLQQVKYMISYVDKEIILKHFSNVTKAPNDLMIEKFYAKYPDIHEHILIEFEARPEWEKPNNIIRALKLGKELKQCMECNSFMKYSKSRHDYCSLSCSKASKLVREKTKNTNIAKELSLPPVKLHCSMLAEDAIKAAIKNYKVKRQSLEQNGSSSKN